MRIVTGDLADPMIVDLLQVHLASSRAQTAPGSAHALDLTGLQAPGITFWAMWDGDSLVGVGALKRLAPDHGEVKSMHIAQTRRRTGAGSLMLRHIIEAARHAGMRRLSLETGSWDHFRPARTLYGKHGFVACPPFADYRPDPNSVFMTLALSAADAPPRPDGPATP
ncbi:GNAT family N-acetyltransferase [Marinivivus vitaminiproducens]|uniref:GNAT family N-acetyltransferase n=1 Tax=Marinivivus vitaminiproducens TaxID=3035935 RepID=UPI0027A0DFE1|nr:GNAT family N-acetyltransferase [Geminicoccaceae bacterium SCSIO 64248]